MADVKWSSFPSGGALLGTDQIVGLRAGNNERFNATDIVWTGNIGNTVFVSTNGSDSTGTGTLQKPYATVAHAMTTITTATPTNPFNIAVFGGKIIETSQILLKPNIGIIGLGQQVVIQQTANTILHSSYLNASSSSTSISGLTMGSIDFDFSSASVVAGHVINIDNAGVGSITINANSNVLPTLSIKSVGMANITVNNCILLLYGSTLNNFTGGDLASIRQLSTIVIGNSFSGSLDLNSETNGFNCVYFFRGNYIQNPGAVTLTNNRSFWHSDSSSYQNPTIVNGGSIVLDTISDGIDANYTPAHYVPVATSPNLATSVQAHLHGIDDALGGVTFVNTNSVYVSFLGGSDTGGDGWIANPFKTIAHAMSTITTATAANNFTIVLLDTVYNESAQIKLKEYVNIASYNMNVTINNALDIILDNTSWASAGAGFAYYNNLFINGNINIDFSSFTPTNSPYLQFNNVQVQGSFHFNGGHVNSPNGGGGMSISNSFLYFTVFIDCANSFISQGNIYYNNLNIGTLDATNFCNAFSNGDSLQAVNIGKTPITAGVFYTATGSSTASVSITDSGGAVRYTADASSYVTPTITGTPSIVLEGSVLQLKGNNVYVSTESGDDKSGTGTFNNPWKTIAHAIASITPSGSHNFNIILFRGNYTEGNLVIKPFISIDGGGSTLLCTGAITADASWSGGGSFTMKNFDTVFDFFSGMTFNTSTAGFNGCDIYIENIKVWSVNPTAFIGSGSATNVRFNNVNATISPSFTNCNFTIANSNMFFINADVNTVSDAFLANIMNSNCQEVHITGDGTPQLDVRISNTPIFFALTAAGNKLNLFVTVDSIGATTIPVLSGGATVTYVNVADALESNLTPTGYTPTNTSVKGNLQGISNKLDNVTGTYDTTNPIVNATTGWTSFTLGYSLIQRTDDIVTMNVTFSGVPSATNQSVQLLVPFTTQFPTVLLASGVGSLFLTSGATAVNGGFVDAISSVSGQRYVRIDSSCLVAGVGLNFTMQAIFSYQVQP